MDKQKPLRVFTTDEDIKRVPYRQTGLTVRRLRRDGLIQLISRSFETRDEILSFKIVAKTKKSTRTVESIHQPHEIRPWGYLGLNTSLADVAGRCRGTRSSGRADR